MKLAESLLGICHHSGQAYIFWHLMPLFIYTSASAVMRSGFCKGHTQIVPNGLGHVTAHSFFIIAEAAVGERTISSHKALEEHHDPCAIVEKNHWWLGLILLVVASCKEACYSAPALKNKDTFQAV